MANTVMSAKNTFAEGLVMDFAPDNTQATTLTSVLNATLLTFNGNEMSLQNDMGNGRVETAYLPEGYVPVGTCEFGDIIYIVSYNPIINKSQIGCFPSPERNISSDEVGGLGQSLKWTDFQGSDGSGPNGEIVASSVKKILYGTKDMTSGDKYIIYSAELDSAGNHEYLSDYGNTSHQHERFPKLVKIHVVSIEESGKITYLDSSTKWYKENDFYIQNSKKIVDKPDLDSYRTMVSSAYSIFSSKVSGKLALLVELEKITGFSCTWSAYTKEMDDNSDYQLNKYSIYWNFSWNTDDNNINPNAVVLTQSKWTGEDDTHAGKYQIWEKDEDRDGWVLGGKNKNWVDGPSIPVAYPNIDYNYRTISRVYNPETYRGTFENFINSGSYDAQSKARLDQVKQELGLSNVELIKANLSRNTEGTPDEGKYYFNCSSSSISKDGKVTYYTNYENELKAISPKEMSDDIINNTFNYPIVKHFADFLIPIKQKVVEDNVEEWKNLNINNLIYYYELTPSMPYGLLREFSQDGYIDFKKIGTKSIELNSWRYYNYENTSTLTWGLEAYTEPNKGISEVVFLFYDNQGLAAAYHNSGKISYNGKFTEYFTLNASGTNYKLNNKNEKNEIFYHKGEQVSKDSAIASNIYLDSDGNVTPIDKMGDEDYYLNDAGTLYSNCLYLVKIVVKYCNIGVLGDYIEDETQYIEDFRWFWTNTMFNEYYYSVYDFKDLKFNLSFNCDAVFETVGNIYEIKQGNYYAKDDYTTGIDSNNGYKSMSAIVQYINQDGSQEDSIKMAVRAGLVNDYGMFNIKKSKTDRIDVRIHLAKEYISNSPEQPSVKYTGNEVSYFEGIYPTQSASFTGKVDSTTSKTLNSLVGSNIIGTGPEIYDNEDAYTKYTNNFHLYSNVTTENIGNTDDNKLVYIDSDGNETDLLDSYTTYSAKLSAVQYDEDQQKIVDGSYYPLTLSGIHYSKFYYHNIKNTSQQLLTSFVVDQSDLDDYQLSVFDNKIFFNKIFLCTNSDESGHSCYMQCAISEFSNSLYCSKADLVNTYDKGGDGNIDVHNGLDVNSGNLSENFHFLFPFGYGNQGRHTSPARINGVKISDNARVRTGYYKTSELGGTLAGITSAGQVEPGDHHSSANSLTNFIPQVLGYLTQLFYLTTSSETTLFTPNNYIYLSDNYTSYRRDIVIKLSSDEGSDLILFRTWDYSKYIQSILEQFNGVDNDQLEPTAKNIDLQIYSCLKTVPIEFRFNYITPTSYNSSTESTILVQSVYSDIPSSIQYPLNSNRIYYWNPETKTFDDFRSAKKLRQVKSYTIQDGGAISSSISNNTAIFQTDSMNQLLEIDGNQLLSIKAFPSSTGTYSVGTHNKQDGQGKNRSLTDYKTNLKFFK